MKITLLLAAALAVIVDMPTSAQSPSPSIPLGSRVFNWEALVVKPTAVGERRDVTDQPTVTLERFECHISTLNPGLASHPPHTHPQEELIILHEGTLEVFINGETQRVGPGSMFWFASQDPHAVRNVGEKPATYFVFNFATARTRTVRPVGEHTPPAGALASRIFHWHDLAVEPTPVGERRAIIDAATTTCSRFRCHATTLNGGEQSHAPHRHPDEEIILVKDGNVEATINGVAHRGGPGSIFFFASNDEHGLRNAGSSPATYYVIRVETEATPRS
jgi:quercetin dioxygenase-like cupin family protein